MIQKYSITDKCIGCTACAKVCPSQAISGERGAMHSINPVKCIECGACGRLCPKSAVLDSKGVSVAMLKKSEWEKPVFNLSRCINCGVCVDACPTKCISMERMHKDGIADESSGEVFPKLTVPQSCVSCGMCQFYCQVRAIEFKKLAAPAPVAAAS